MTYRVRNIGIAVALAVVAALLVSWYLANYRRHVQTQEEPAPVLVAVRDIPAGTPGSEIVSGHYVAVKQVVTRNVVPGAFSSPSEVEKLVANQAVYAGEQVNAHRFGNIAQIGPRAQLKGTLRAYSVAGDENQLLAGTLRDGDHVDLVAAIKVKRDQNGDDVIFSRVVLRDLKVLHAPSPPAAGSKLTGSAGQSFSAMLAMSDSQAQKFQFVLAATSGDAEGAWWHLELRPVVKASDSPDHLDHAGTVLGDGLSAAQRKLLHGGPAR